MDTAKKLDIASSECAALWQEKGHLEEHLEALSQNLKSAQEELNVSAVSSWLGLSLEAENKRNNSLLEGEVVNFQFLLYSLSVSRMLNWD